MTRPWTLLALFVLLLAGGASSNDIVRLPAHPGDPSVTGIVTVGDTLVYAISWGPGARATSYDIRTVVSATNGSWTVVADSTATGKWTSGNGIGALAPGQSGTVTTTSLKTWLAAIPWDSATFTFTVSSRNSVGVSAAVSTSWTVRRKPGPPGPITVDSSLTITSLRVLPDSVTVAVGEVVQFCALVQFANGVYALRANDADAPECVTAYQQTIPAALRAVTVGQQAVADSLCVLWEATGGTIEQEPCALAPALLERRGLLWTVAVR